MMYNEEQYKNAKKDDLIDCICDKCGKSFFRTKRILTHIVKYKKVKSFSCSKTCKGTLLKTHKDTACLNCGIGIAKGKNKYCSGSCAAISNNKLYHTVDRIKFECKGCFKTFELLPHIAKSRMTDFCSKKCKGVKAERDKIDVKCGFCLKDIRVDKKRMEKASKLKAVFCSRSCRTRYVHKNINPTKNASRSVPQKTIKEIIVRHYPNLMLEENCRSVLDCGYELDLYFPTLNFAIEVNGPTHYTPIYGEENFVGIKHRDSVKHAEAYEKGIAVLVIDVSKLQKKYTQSFMLKHFTESVEPIITGKLKKLSICDYEI